MNLKPGFSGVPNVLAHGVSTIKQHFIDMAF
jgi:hypothetical protein